MCHIVQQVKINFLSIYPTFECKQTCHQRPPVLRDHIFMANRVFQDRFYCITDLLQREELSPWGDCSCGPYSFQEGQ